MLKGSMSGHLRRGLRSWSLEILARARIICHQGPSCRWQDIKGADSLKAVDTDRMGHKWLACPTLLAKKTQRRRADSQTPSKRCVSETQTQCRQQTNPRRGGATLNNHQVAPCLWLMTRIPVSIISSMVLSPLRRHEMTGTSWVRLNRRARMRHLTAMASFFLKVWWRQCLRR